MDLHKNISIAIVGPVSAGKSTLLNAIFTNTFTGMNIKRTTMTPQVYRETSSETVDNSSIRKQNEELNKKLIQMTESNQKLSISDIQEQVHDVKKIINFVPLIYDYHFTIYDIPGLNDARTKDVYFQYLTENFHKFDVILFVIDINSSLNTSDEILILEKILEGCKQNHEKEINTSLVIIANKCDNLFLNDSGELKLDDELQEMHSQISLTLKQKIEEIHPQTIYSILPMSSEDAYIYRMFKSGLGKQLDIKYIDKFGFNEFGKSKWASIPSCNKRDKINSLLTGFDFDKALVITGFNNLVNQIKDKLTEEVQLKIYCNRLLTTMKTKDYFPDNVDEARNTLKIFKDIASHSKVDFVEESEKIIIDSFKKYETAEFSRYFRPSGVQVTCSTTVGANIGTIPLIPYRNYCAYLKGSQLNFTIEPDQCTEFITKYNEIEINYNVGEKLDKYEEIISTIENYSQSLKLEFLVKTGVSYTEAYCKYLKLLQVSVPPIFLLHRLEKYNSNFECVIPSMITNNLFVLEDQCIDVLKTYLNKGVSKEQVRNKLLEFIDKRYDHINTNFLSSGYRYNELEVTLLAKNFWQEFYSSPKEFKLYSKCSFKYTQMVGFISQTLNNLPNFQENPEDFEKQVLKMENFYMSLK